jgi:hypothetical protein
MKGRARFACTLLAFASLAADKPPASVAILGGASLELTDVTSPNVLIPVTFVEKNGKDAMLAVTVSTFVGPGGPIEPTVSGNDPSSIALKPHGQATLTLEASLLNAGKYRAVVHALATAGPTTTALDDLVISITRTRSLPPFDVAAVPANQVEIGWGDTRVTSPFDLHVYGVDKAFTVPEPRLLNATRKPKADSAAGTSTTLTLAGGKALSVTAAQATPATMSLTNITGAGRYDATLRFAAPGYQPVDTAVTAFVREPWHHAFLFIFIGVLVSFGVHAYTNTIRPRLLTEQRVTAWREQLDAARESATGDPDALALVDGVSSRIGSQWDKARQLRVLLGTDADVYDTIVPAVPQWIAMHRQLLVVRPVEVRDKLMPKLTDAALTFGGPTPDAAKVKTAVETIAALPGELATTIGDTLRAEVTKLDTQLAADPRQSVTELRNLLQLVLQKIANEEYDAAIGSFDAARLRYVAILGDDLVARTTLPARPTGFTEQQWKDLQKATTWAVQQLRSTSDADQAMTVALDASTNYVRLFMAALKRTVAPLGDDAASKVAALNTEMENALTDGDLTTAWRKLEAAQTEVAAAIKAKTGSPMDMSAADFATVPITGFDPLAAFNLPPSWAGLARQTAAHTARTITMWDILISVIVLVAAGAIGIQTLWVDNATWGGGAAYLAAFLWGFAAHQFTHAGVTALGKE